MKYKNPSSNRRSDDGRQLAKPLVLIRRYSLEGEGMRVYMLPVAYLYYGHG
jgi:hypothetical protein